MRFLTTRADRPVSSQKRGSPSDAPRALQLAFVLLVVAVYGGSIFYLSGLSFEPIKDEDQFWVQVQSFAESWPPTVGQLRNYQQPMTPIAFLVWAGLESWHHLGIAAGRLVTIAASLAVLAMIGLRRPAPGAKRATPVLAAAALLLYPYWLPLSLLIYTDVPASLFIALGFWLYVRERHVASAVVFALAIGTRQYAVTFPAAIVAYEGLAALRARAPAWSRWLPYVVATASLFAWFAFFGGAGPEAGLEEWPRHLNAFARINPAFCLSFLASIGAYFVVPEFVLDRRWRNLALRVDRRTVLSLAIVVLFFAIFTPNHPNQIGVLNRALNFVLGKSALGGAVRLALLLGLAYATVLRFMRLDIGTWVVATNVGMFSFVWAPWEKYCMPVLVALWFLKSAGALDERAPGVPLRASAKGDKRRPALHL
jgi:hypothetical protein